MSEFEQLHELEESMRLRFREIDEQLIKTFQQTFGDTLSEEFLRSYLLLEGAEDKPFIREAAQFPWLLNINDVQFSFMESLNADEVEALSLWAQNGEYSKDFYISGEDDSLDGAFVSLRAERAIKGQRASALYLFSTFYGRDKNDFQNHFLRDVRAYFLSVLSRDLEYFQLDVPPVWNEKFQQDAVLNKAPDLYDEWNNLNGKITTMVEGDKQNRQVRIQNMDEYSDEPSIDFVKAQLFQFSQTPPYSTDPELFVDHVFGATQGQIHFS